MRRDNRGISRIVEFVIMFTVFLVIVTSFYSLVNIWTRLPIVNYNQEEAMGVSEILIGNPGCMDNNNSKTNWEEYPAYYKGAPNIDTNMTSLGFAKDKNSYGVLSMGKILGMGKITYSKAREMLALSPGQNFNISFQIIGSETKTCWGADYTSAKNVGMYKRIVAVYNPINNSYVPAKLTICLFDGGKINESIVINEIMYNPPVPLSNEDHEWVELHNPTSMSINLTNWLIGNKQNGVIGWAKLKGEDDSDVGLRGAIIPANSYGIIYDNGSISSVKKNYTHNSGAVWLKQFDSNPVVNDDIAGDLLDNGGDTIILRNRYYDEVDNVSYSPDWGGNGNSESLEKINPLGASNDPANWGNSTTNGKNGTLGRRNSISDFSNPNLGNLISIGPDRCNVSCVENSIASFNITVMNNGNINDTITISNISGWNVNITHLSGGNATPVYLDGSVAVNLSAINLTDNISHIYVKLMVNVTIPTGSNSGDQNICAVIAKSTNSIDIATLLTRVS